MSGLKSGYLNPILYTPVSSGVIFTTFLLVTFCFGIYKMRNKEMIFITEYNERMNHINNLS